VKVEALVQQCVACRGVCAGREMDADHNRCVITLAGEPDAVGERRFWARARMELIDMNEHKGAHPRWSDGCVRSFRWRE